MMSRTDSPNGQTPTKNTHAGAVVASRGSRHTPAPEFNSDDAVRLSAPGDVHLEKLIDRALRGTGHLCLGDLHVIVSGGVIVLRGKLPRYYLKQVTHAIVRAIPGVLEIHDEIEIV